MDVAGDVVAMETSGHRLVSEKPATLWSRVIQRVRPKPQVSIDAKMEYPKAP